MTNRFRSLISLRQLAALSILLLAVAVMAQPMTSILARLAPVTRAARQTATKASKDTATAASKDRGKPAQTGQDRVNAIQTAFTNNTAILIPATQNAIAGVANPYPSTIAVSGLTGAISSMTVTLNNFHHSQQKDVDMLLVGPTGATFVFMSDIGGADGAPPGAHTFNLTFDDTAATQAPVTVITAAGTFKPTNSGAGDPFASPAPAGPYNEAAPAASSTFTSVYGGSNPNGNWNLYAVDDTGGDFGACDLGWTLNITTSVSAAPTTTTITSSLNPSLTTDMVSFTAHVVKTSDSSNVTLGNVTFVDNSTGTVLATNVALNGSGMASTPAVSLTERSHLITATYNPDPSFLGSSGSLTQVVDFPTSNPTPGEYCNTNSISVPEAPATSGTAVQYPSHITVAGLGGKISHLVVTLNNVSHTEAQDLDVLLVAPGGQNLVIVSDTGGTTSNVTVNFDDNAPGQLAASGAWGGAGTTVSSQPVDRVGGVDTYPAPAPAVFNSPAPVGAATLGSIFNNTNPNGKWSLYIVDDAGGDVGTFAGGWCLTFTTTNGAALDFDGDGTSDYAVVRDSGLPRGVNPSDGTVFQSPAPSKDEADETNSLNSGPPLMGRGYFRLPGERFDPLAPQLERPDAIQANQLRWLIHTSGPTADLNVLFGRVTDFPVPADFDGDGKCDIAVWTGGVGAMFKVLTSSSGFVTEVDYVLGGPSSDPSVVGDYDGDGRADPAVFNDNTGQWTYLGGPTHSSLVTVTPVGAVGGEFPIPGDYNGDGKFDFMTETRDGINPTMGHFYEWLNNGTTTPPATTNFTFGNYRDVIMPSDYDGDGATDIGNASVIVNPIAWRIRLSPAGSMLGPFNLGDPSVDYTLSGDYNGDGKGDLTIWHSPGTFQTLFAPTYTSPPTSFSWGQPGDYPVAYFNSH